MNELLYAKDGRIYSKDYLEIYIPSDYEADGFAINKGDSFETIGIVYIRSYANGVEGPIKLLNIPSIVNISTYDISNDEIKVNGRTIKVIVSKYLKDSYILHQSIQEGKGIAESFLNTMLMGKLPRTLQYSKILDIWWRNLEIANVNFKVPSKIYEMIIASIYRNPNNFKERYGQHYGRQSNPNGYDYATGNVRGVVEGLSTFSGLVFEDINRMITTGINNSIEGNEEAVSPLEKIIYY